MGQKREVRCPGRNKEYGILGGKGMLDMFLWRKSAKYRYCTPRAIPEADTKRIRSARRSM